MILFKDYPQLMTICALAKQRKLEVHLVGGFLRDYVLNRQGMDFDFAVSCDALVLAKAVALKLKGAFVLLDQEHGCARVVKKIQGQAYTFDFADFRAKTFKGDLALRDFTINTLSLDISKLSAMSSIDDCLKDHKGGLRDLKARRIQMTGPKAFSDDPLRMMRAFSLKAVLDFKIEAKTLAAIKKQKDSLRQVSYERIRDELFKILDTNRAGENLKSMDKVGLLENIIPQVRVMYGCHQGGYHHLDVWQHSLETVVQLDKVCEQFQDDQEIKAYFREPLGGNRSRQALMKLAALLHDIGKPDTRKLENGKYSFHSHEHVGRNMAKGIAKMLKLSKAERFCLEDLVLWHLRPGYLSNFKQPSDKALYWYFRDTKQEAASIALLSLADQRSTRGPLTSEEDQQHHEHICRNLITRYFNQQKQIPFVCLLNGHDLIKEFKLKPSPVFGKILKTVAEQQSLGQITTKPQALQLAREMIKKSKENPHESKK